MSKLVDDVEAVLAPYFGPSDIFLQVHREATRAALAVIEKRVRELADISDTAAKTFLALGNPDADECATRHRNHMAAYFTVISHLSETSDAD